MKVRIYRGLFAAAALAVSLTVATPARAATIQLGFLLDSSGSIGAVNWGIITNGLASAINTHIPVGGLDTYEVSVVTFSSGTQTIVDHMLIDGRWRSGGCSGRHRRGPVPESEYELRSGIRGHPGCVDRLAPVLRRGPVLPELRD